jgi:hypothetical protein
MVKFGKKITEPGRILPARLKLLYEVLKALKDDGSCGMISSRWSFSYLCCHSGQLSGSFRQHLIGLCLQKTQKQIPGSLRVVNVIKSLNMRQSDDIKYNNYLSSSLKMFNKQAEKECNKKIQ